MLNDDDERDVDVSLLARVYGEYLEMPGIQLTLAQASRLWNAERVDCAQALETLVEASFLRRAGDCYVRVDSGWLCA